MNRTRPIIVEFSGISFSGKKSLLDDVKKLCEENGVSVCVIQDTNLPNELSIERKNALLSKKLEDVFDKMKYYDLILMNKGFLIANYLYVIEADITDDLQIEKEELDTSFLDLYKDTYQKISTYKNHLLYVDATEFKDEELAKYVFIKLITLL